MVVGVGGLELEMYKVLHVYTPLEPPIQACPSCSEPHSQHRDPSLNPIPFFLFSPRIKWPGHAEGLPFGRLCLCAHSLSPLHFLLQPSPRCRHRAIPENQVLESGWIQRMDSDW